MSSSHHPPLRCFHWLVVCALLINGFGAAFLPQSVAQAAPLALAGAESAVRVAYLYKNDEGTAQSFANLLNGNGYAVQAFQYAATPEAPFKVMLPLITGGGTGAANASSIVALPTKIGEIPNFANFDLIIVAADSGANDQWQPAEGLFEAIQNSGLPVVGLGTGGHALFGRLGLPNGYPHGVAGTAATIQVADFGDSQPLYGGITLTENSLLQVYQSAQPVISIPLADRLENGVRLAALENDGGSFPIVQAEQRYLLWGFEGSADSMTETGKQLFRNALHFGAQNIELTLQSRSFTPDAGVDPALLAALQGTSGLHAYAQLTHLPSESEREALKQSGVTLLNFVGDTLYYAFVSPTINPADALFSSLVRWLGPIPAPDKIAPDLYKGNYEPWAVTESGALKLLVTFHQDVTDAAAQAILQALGTSGELYGEHVMATLLAKEKVETLAQQDGVAWIDMGPAPLQPLNDVARNDLNVNLAQLANTATNPAYYGGLDGSTVTVGIFDTGVNTPTFTHNDFAGRLVRTQNDTNGHGSHVAGIVGASGANSVSNCPGGSCTPYQYRGMAPNVKIAPYGSWNAATMDEAVNTYHIEASNHSYIQNCGAYDSLSQTVDMLVRGQLTNGGTAIPMHTVVWAAANQGGGAQYCTTGTLPDGSDPDTNPDPDPTTGPRGYFSVLSPSKNSIDVGAYNPGDPQSVTSFSSRGPTWDGRLKPDVMAPGCMTSTDNKTQGYVGKCGTSMASPAVTGIVALLTEQYHQSFSSAGRPMPSTIKALLVQTANDMIHMPGQPGFSEFGWNDPDTGQPVIYQAGPDWSTGYGAVNAQKAASYIKAHNFLEGTVTPADANDSYTVNVLPGQSELKITLAWDDEPGNPAWGVQAKQLVNNLDLSLVAPDGVTVWRPWVLPALPRAALNGMGQDIGTPDPIVRATNIVTATRGVDNLNNLEQVQVPNPAAGVWTIRVNAASLPNGNPQKYSLAGDFRTFNIVNPKTGNVAEAGDPATPNVFPVVLEGVRSTDGSPSALADVTASEFSVQIEGTAATIINGSPVGDQFWLMVRPAPGVYSAGSKYDLSVTWNGHGSDSETRAVLFTEREITDRAVVIDHSGSMDEFDKMAAAQNAARLFVDQSLPQDRIAVVSFSDNSTVNYPTTLVPDAGPSAVLDAAKSAINGLTPSGMTAIGKGLLDGQAQVTAAPADHSVADVIILLSDGMENVDPLYNTPAVKGVIEPTDTIIHTVAVGPASAGFHSLLETIADDNGGEFRAVNETGAGVMASATDATVQTGIEAWPTTLPNRLGDVYKQYAEEVLNESRLFQARGVGNPVTGALQTFDINVPSSLSRINFSFNWAQPNGNSVFQVVDPKQHVYTFKKGDTQNKNCRGDDTHVVCIIEAPEPGIWKTSQRVGGEVNEWALWVSAKAAVSFQLWVGTPERQRVMGQPVQLLGFLGEGEKALAGQSIKLNIFFPGGSSRSLELLDDGLHGDGVADDGLYSNIFGEGSLPGAYAVRGVAEGKDMLGQPFTLFKNTGFHLRPKVVYVHKGDMDTAEAYRNLIENNGVAVDQISMDQLPTTNLSPYNLVIIAPETGSLDQWGTDEMVRQIVQYKKPVLGWVRAAMPTLARSS
ncbi:MAG: S8 family serine peptidase [Caldilineaceae bacterium]